MITLDSADTLKESIETSAKLLLLDFYADWCGPCKRLTPKLEELETEYTNTLFYKINVDELDDLTEEYSIKCMPTIIFIKNGNIIDRIEGSDLTAIKSNLAENN